MFTATNVYRWLLRGIGGAVTMLEIMQQEGFGPAAVDLQDMANLEIRLSNIQAIEKGGPVETEIPNPSWPSTR